MAVLFCTFTADATLVYSDDFNRATIAGGTYSYSTTVTAGDGAASINNSKLLLSNDGSGAANGNGIVYVTTAASGFGPSYNSQLSLNPGLVTWTFNMQQIRTDPGGIQPGSYGVGFILGASSGTLTTASGYAVILGNGGTTDPIRLTKFTGGIGTLTDIISASAPLSDVGANYLSLRVTYDPAGDIWNLYGRDDGTSNFADPTSGTLSSLGSGSDSTYVNTTLTHLGSIWSYNTAAGRTAQFDNFSVDVALAPVPEPINWAMIGFGTLFGGFKIGRYLRSRTT